jgi:hypothetical protein
VTEKTLKETIKLALIEVLDERPELLANAIEKVIEDIGMAKAMDEAIDSPRVDRSEVFDILSREE